MNFVNWYGGNWNGFAGIAVFCHVTCRYFRRFLLQGVDRNWHQACHFHLALYLICEGYWQVNSRWSIFCIVDPNYSNHFASSYCKVWLPFNKYLFIQQSWLHHSVIGIGTGGQRELQPPSVFCSILRSLQLSKTNIQQYQWRSQGGHTGAHALPTWLCAPPRYCDCFLVRV